MAGCETRDNDILVAENEDDRDDIFCDPCQTEGQMVRAMGHCMDCGEFICDLCIKVHKKISALKKHVIQDLSNSPSSQEKEPRTNTKHDEEGKDPLVDRCLDHPDELVEYFCNQHRALCCTVCTVDHRLCKDLVHIRDVSKKFASSNELQKILHELKNIVEKLTATKERARWIKQTLNASYTKTVVDIAKIKQGILEILDQLEQQLVEEADEIKDEEMEGFNSMITKCEKLVKETEQIIADCDQMKNTGHNNKMFIFMKQTQNRIYDLTLEASRMLDECKCERLFFKPDLMLVFIYSIDKLGTLSLESAECDQDIVVKSDTDSFDCFIRGAAMIPDGRLALSDSDNMSIKLVDLKQRKVTEEVILYSEPADLCYMKEDKIAVTFTSENYVQVLSTLPSLAISHTVSLPGSQYGGIQYIPDIFILVCRDPVLALQICESSGVLLKQIERDEVGNNLFTWPSRLALSPTHDLIYVTDFDENTLMSFTMDGKLLHKYCGEELNQPKGVVVDDDGNVYVCSLDDHSVKKFSHRCELMGAVIEEKNGLRIPCEMCLCGDKLYVSSGSSMVQHANNIKVYKLQDENIPCR